MCAYQLSRLLDTLRGSQRRQKYLAPASPIELLCGSTGDGIIMKPACDGWCSHSHGALFLRWAAQRAPRWAFNALVFMLEVRSPATSTTPTPCETHYRRYRLSPSTPPPTMLPSAHGCAAVARAAVARVIAARAAPAIAMRQSRGTASPTRTGGRAAIRGYGGARHLLGPMRSGLGRCTSAPRPTCLLLMARSGIASADCTVVSGCGFAVSCVVRVKMEAEAVGDAEAAAGLCWYSHMMDASPRTQLCSCSKR